MKKLTSPFSREIYERNAQIYKLLANPKRLEILNILKLGEGTVDQLAEALDAKKANVSQHLAVLRYLKMVRVRPVGKNRFYRLADPRLVTVCRVLKDLWQKGGVLS